MSTHMETGRSGENLAITFFEEKGYRIVEQNWRHHHLEVDLIAEHQGVLHIIEVKTRSSGKYAFPEENVTRSKIRNLMHAAAAYLAKHQQYKRIQVDVLSITMHEKNATYFLIEDIYAW